MEQPISKQVAESRDDVLPEVQVASSSPESDGSWEALCKGEIPVLPKGPWSHEDFEEKVSVGKGKDTVIYSAACRKYGGRKVAIKVYEKSKVSPSKLRAIRREISMMIYMARKRIPYITQFHGAFQDDRHICLVMEYCSGGDLLDKLLGEGRAFAEGRVVSEVAFPLLTALKYLHGLDVIHRDIKLENIFIAADGGVRLGDFGLTMSMRQEKAISPVGTIEYMAPEVVALPAVDLVVSGAVKVKDIKPCNEKVDIWALGVTLYELVTGNLPFEGENKAETKAAIAEGRMRPLPSRLSTGCASLISQMLTRDPSKRPSAERLLNHPFITAHMARLQALQRPLKPPGKEALLDSAGSVEERYWSAMRSADGSMGQLAAVVPSFTAGTVKKTGLTQQRTEGTDSVASSQQSSPMIGSSPPSMTGATAPGDLAEPSAASAGAGSPRRSPPSKSKTMRMLRRMWSSRNHHADGTPSKPQMSKSYSFSVVATADATGSAAIADTPAGKVSPGQPIPGKSSALKSMLKMIMSGGRASDSGVPSNSSEPRISSAMS